MVPNSVGLALLLRIEEVAAFLSIGRTRAYQLVMSGQIQSVTRGRMRPIPRVAVERFVEHLVERAKAD